MGELKTCLEIEFEGTRVIIIIIMFISGCTSQILYIDQNMWDSNQGPLGLSIGRWAYTTQQGVHVDHSATMLLKPVWKASKTLI